VIALQVTPYLPPPKPNAAVIADMLLKVLFSVGTLPLTPSDWFPSVFARPFAVKRGAICSQLFSYSQSRKHKGVC
jgi:hypothetical protein